MLQDIVAVHQTAFMFEGLHESLYEQGLRQAL